MVDTNANGVFDATRDYILFYGQGIESKYTKENIYWLTHGSATGLTMGTRNGTPGAQAVPPFYPATRLEEKNLVYAMSMMGADNLERFYWD